MSLDGRYRLRFNFWLDVMKPEEEALADQIELLKNERGFASAIRDGLRVIGDLRRGEWGSLTDLFPGVVQGIQNVVCVEWQIKAERLAAQVEAKNAEIERLHRVIQSMQQPVPAGLLNPNDEATQPTKPIGGLKPIGGSLKPLAPPIDDDDDDFGDLLQINKAQNTGQAAQNFIAAMNALQG